MEWHRDDQFCSYNSWKCIFYEKWFRNIVDWYKTPDIQLLPPIEASIDAAPNGACNLRCKWCNAYKYLNKAPAISDKKFYELHQFLLDWGVKAFCEGGLGEPTLRKNLGEVLLLIKKFNRQSSIATNGTLFNDELMDIATSCCRWVGVSVDASNAKTFEKTKGKNLFNKVINNISKLAKLSRNKKSNCDISYKFLVTPWNYKEIFEACKIAKSLGVRDFYARVADLGHQGLGENKLREYNYAVEEIKDLFAKCHSLRDNNFRVFTSVHKFNDDLKPRKNFRQCWAMPLLIQCCPDGNVYACVDQRIQEFYRLGSFLPQPSNILNFWGGEKHWNLTFKEGFKHCSCRCTFSFYCEVIEKLFIEEDKDRMCRWFT